VGGEQLQRRGQLRAALGQAREERAQSLGADSGLAEQGEGNPVGLGFRLAAIGKRQQARADAAEQALAEFAQHQPEQHL